MTVWTPLPGTVLQDLQEEGCQDSGEHEKWQVLVGAPGYAIASAVYCFNPIPSMVFGGIPGYPQQTWPRCTERVRE